MEPVVKFARMTDVGALRGTPGGAASFSSVVPTGTRPVIVLLGMVYVTLPAGMVNAGAAVRVKRVVSSTVTIHDPVPLVSPVIVQEACLWWSRNRYRGWQLRCSR
jgi:hypothetical protein